MATALTRPATLAGLPLVADAAATPVVTAAIGVAPAAKGTGVAGGYGTGPVTLAAGAWGIGSPDPVMTITSRIAAFSDRTGATTAKAASIPLEGATMQCVATTAAAPLPTGSLCVWSDPTSTGQVWLAGAAPQQAGVVATEVHDTLAK